MSQPASSLPALHRGLAIIEAVARARAGLSFSDCAALLGRGTPPSTVSRLLAALVESGMIVQDDGKHYCAGARLHQLGRHLDGSQSLADLAADIVDQLAERSGESSACFRWNGTAAELVAKHELPERFRYMAVGGVNDKTSEHGFARLLCPQTGDIDRGAVLINGKDDQPGLARIVALAADDVAIGITCLAASLTRSRRADLSAAVGVAAQALAGRLEQP